MFRFFNLKENIAIFKFGSFLGLSVLLYTFNAYNATGEIWRKNQSQSQPCNQPGFSAVDQKDNEPIIGEDVHVLTCSGCGTLVCEWSSHPTFGEIPNDIGAIINQRVAAGIYSGSESSVRNGITWYYTWTFNVGTNKLDANIWIVE
jgi:hypothetical protein